MKFPLRTLTQYARHLFLRNRPAYMVLFVTSQCNARCSVCFNLKNVLAPSSDELSLEGYQSLAKQFGPLPQLLISGGEPFLRKDLPQIVESFYRSCGTRLITIPTNGMLVDKISDSFPDMLDRCPGASFNLNLSLDGAKEAHDAFRAVPGAYDMALETFQWAKAFQKKTPRFMVNISTTITAENYAQMEPFIHFVREELQPDFHLVGMDRAIINKSHIPKDKIHSIFRLADRPVTKPKGGILFQTAQMIIDVIRDLDRETLDKKNRPFTCLAGRKIIVVSETGEVYPCEPFWFPGLIRYSNETTRPPSFSLGNLKSVNMDLRHLLKQPSAKLIFKWIDSKNCTCHYECVYYNSILYSFWRYTGRFLKHMPGSFRLRREV